MVTNQKLYVIIDIRSDPPEFLNENNVFIKGFSNAKRLTIEEGGTIIDGFNGIGDTIGSNSKVFMPGLMHIKNFIK